MLNHIQGRREEKRKTNTRFRQSLGNNPGFNSYLAALLFLKSREKWQPRILKTVLLRLRGFGSYSVDDVVIVVIAFGITDKHSHNKRATSIANNTRTGKEAKFQAFWEGGGQSSSNENKWNKKTLLSSLMILLCWSLLELVLFLLLLLMFVPGAVFVVWCFWFCWSHNATLAGLRGPPPSKHDDTENRCHSNFCCLEYVVRHFGLASHMLNICKL